VRLEEVARAGASGSWSARQAEFKATNMASEFHISVLSDGFNVAAV
jgi:hypothetical protein